MSYSIYKPNRQIVGSIHLTGSKSISNRALIIRALCKEDFEISALAIAHDTDLMQQLLKSDSVIRDAGPAGTTFRFLTAYLSLQPGMQILTGTERMKARPIGVLVNVLRQLGANIEYLEKEGYPPLKIDSPNTFGTNAPIRISAGTSSQYISALLMIAPTLKNGLEMILEGKIVSRPYIEMTLNLMQYFGVSHQWEGNVIKIKPQAYKARPFRVEADWSAASYYYALAAFADKLDLQLDGLFQNSVQGDSVLVEMMEHFGIKTTFNKSGLCLTKAAKKISRSDFDWDFLRCPDLAQTLFVVCGGKGRQGYFTGLETLRIKETDRIYAMQKELAKVGVKLEEAKKKSAQTDKLYYQVNGQVAVHDHPFFDTYEDHRMAMALAPLAMFGDIKIAEPEVVGKSYPDFWKDLESLGFLINR